jgi:hypothetical protein
LDPNIKLHAGCRPVWQAKRKSRRTVRGISVAIIHILLLACFASQAQQNNTLFFMHSLPEANFINPAIQGECGLFIGLPVLSSFHQNIANSGFTAGQFVTLYTDGSMSINTDFDTDKLAKRNYFLTEDHLVLLAAGLRRNKLYFTFSITEKDNSTFIYTPDLVAFSLRGSDEFEGTSINLNGTQLVFNHYREYAFGVSKKYSDNLTLGVKVKLLFGKFNFNTGNTSMGLYIEDGSQDIIFDIDGGYNSSLPVALTEESPGIYRFHETGNATVPQYLMNARNPGFAFDAGFIYKYNDHVTLSGSLLDVGLIFYRSNLSNYSLTGNYSYTGPLGNGQIDRQELLNVFDELNANMTPTFTSNPYTQFLDPRLYLGAAYKLNARYDLNFLLYNRLLPGKLQTGTTVSLLTRPTKALVASISWSYMNHSAANLGLGIGYGKSPLQLYLVSDNIIGFVLPMSTKNVNLRLGINLNLNCREVFNIDQCGCEWLKSAEDRRLRHEKFRQGKKDKGN